MSAVSNAPRPRLPTVWLLPQVGIALAVASVVAWGLSFGGAPVLLQTALADGA